MGNKSETEWRAELKWPDDEPYDRDEHIALQKKLGRELKLSNNMKRKARNKLIVQEYKQDHPCVDCGENDPDLLTFDHPNGRASTDTESVNAMCARTTSLQLLRYLSELEVRCANCHLRVTFQRIRAASNPKDRAGSVKPAVHFVPSSLIMYVAPVMEHGAKKYGYRNWLEEPITITGHLDAVFRHLLDVKDGNDVDESGYLHLAHAASGIAVILDAIYHDTLIDDRTPSSGQGAIDE